MMTDTAARIQTPYLLEEDELDRSLRPRRLADFVGQESLREQLSVAIEAAAARGDARWCRASRSGDRALLRRRCRRGRTR